MRIGVLALQGGFAAHAEALRHEGHEAVLIRYPRQVADVDGLVLPGGESSVQLELLRRADLAPAITELYRSGRPVLATCAGLILIARRVGRPEQRSLGWIEIGVERNAWGPQVESFEAAGDRLGRPMVFIRAPRLAEVGEEVEILETLDGEPVLVRQQNVVGTTFHAELTDDPWVARIAFGGQRATRAPTAEVG